jgi:hypothetical protein
MKRKIPTDELWAIRSEAKKRFALAKKAFLKTGDGQKLRSDVAAIKAWLKEQRKRTQYKSQAETIDRLGADFDVEADVLTER